jgi:predicted glutamine amidotransferase
MCRILYSLHQPYAKRKLVDFLAQSESDFCCHQALDGYGIAVLSDNHKWSIYRSINPPLEDLNAKDVAHNYSTGSLIIGHIRRATALSKTSPENTHPFYNKNRIFVHNGYFKDAQSKRAWFYKNIHPEYISKIRGSTDSELVFYLFLSVMDEKKWIYGDIDKLKGKGCKGPNKFDEYREGVIECFRLLGTVFHEYIANFVYADKEYSIVGRLAKNVSKGDRSMHPLYSHPSSNRLLFSTEPIRLVEHANLVEWNTIYVINHLTGEQRSSSI